jgi:hypothetical protein
MAFRIGHATPAVAVLVEVVSISAPRSQRLDFGAGYLDVRDPDIKVHPVLEGLALWNALKTDARHSGGDR